MTRKNVNMDKIKASEININLEKVSLCIDKKTILDNLSLQLSSCQFILMTGQNGSGKSTFLKILSGLLKPDTFKLYKNDQKTSWSASRKYLREHFCYLHQIPYLFSGSVHDNIAYGLKQKGLSKSEIDHKVNEALKIISLQHLSKRDSQTLSGGEKQRVAIARSWVINPSFILLDEPFANMDKHSRYRCYDIINQLKEYNTGIILTSHDPQNGELYFNRRLHLYQGSLSEKEL